MVFSRKVQPYDTRPLQLRLAALSLLLGQSLGVCIVNVRAVLLGRLRALELKPVW